MKRLIAATLLALAGASATATAHAQTIDIDQPLSNFTANNPVYSFVQTFTAVSPTNVGAGFTLSNGLPGGALNTTATISLLTGAPGSGTLLASGTTGWNVPAAPSSGTLVNAFWAPVGLTVGATYWLEIVTGAPSAWIEISNANPYTGGAFHVFFQGAWQPFGEGQWDAEFRTFTTTVPEPSTYALVALGLIAMGAAARRRRA